MVKVAIESELLRDLLSQYCDRALTRAEIVYSEGTGLWWVRVMPIPEHMLFWETFERRFDPGFKKARELKAGIRGERSPFGLLCPEFPSLRSLLNWLYLCTGDSAFLWVPFLQDLNVGSKNEK